MLLFAKALGYQGSAHYEMAAVVEFIHTATLLHDDVVDESALRRGRATANAMFGNAASVLVGDFLYSRSFQMMVSVNEMRVLDVLADAAQSLGARLADVHAVIGDTESLPYTGNSWGSMTVPSVGPAVRMDAEEARRMLIEAMEDVRAGKDPLGVQRDPARNEFSDLLVLSEVIDAKADLDEYCASMEKQSIYQLNPEVNA